MSNVTPGPALSCEGCDTVTAAGELGRDPADFDECPACGSDMTVTVRVEPCPDPSGECSADEHHFGIGAHVIDVNA